MGYWLAEKKSALTQWVGKALLAIAPRLMKILTFVGTLAMFLVGGGIVVHGVAPLHHFIENFAHGLSGMLASTLPVAANLVLGFIIGAIVFGVVKAITALRGKAK